MNADSPKCKVCWDDAIHEIPTILCDACFVSWIEDGDWVIDPGCPVALKRFDDHVAGCGLCCTGLNDFDYCVIGESLEETWAETIDYGDAQC